MVELLNRAALEAYWLGLNLVVTACRSLTIFIQRLHWKWS